MSSRAYCFTYYGENMPQWDETKMKYLVFQKERCPETGREHYQGFARFIKNLTFKQAQDALNVPKAHMEKPGQERTDGSTMGKVDEDNRDYCTKEESRIDGPWEYGTCGKRQGERTDIAEAIDIAKTHGLKRACEEKGATMVKYHKGVEYVLKKLAEEKQEMQALQWRPWQQRMLDRLEQPPHDRKIYYVHDSKGGKGKSTLTRYLVINKGALMCNTTKAADIAFAWNGHKIIIFDLPRAGMEHVNWSAVEAIKNGVMFSAKYESGMKVFPIPHVIVMANSKVPDGTFSDDRLKMIDLDIIAIQ
nr:MAG: replication associated protein [Virus sp.]